MHKTLLLIGSLGLFAAGTASAQTRVSLSIGLGAPRPYFEGVVFVGRPHLRPLYRPYYYYRFHRHRHLRPFLRRPGFGPVEHRPLRRDSDRGRGRFERDRYERHDDE